ncbi:MAG: CPBP family intramembrane metalloprotease [Clostridiales bacterium]|nr:CPBP family intramembrane metalloprotease [Clostridiales bacterium]
MKRALTIIQGFLMAIVAIFLVSLLYTFFISIYVIVTGIKEISPEVNYILMVIAAFVSVVLISIWYRKYMSLRQRDSIVLKKVFSMKNIGIYLMLGIGCQLFISGILAKLRPLFETLFSYYDDTIGSLFGADPLVVILYVIIIAPILEELIMRGILFNRLRYGMTFVVANMIQSMVFGIYHMNLIQGLYAFGTGLILGYIYEKTRTLMAPIFLHMTINALGIILPNLIGEKFVNGWMQIVIGLGLLIVALYLFEINNRHKSVI